ncbi:MAG: hypothetical protein B6226_06230 [Candidatus Cloacimonetes bacterium 4572_65]|nr:MAG: hypothetical protein B6226_06230 [Candidatus Cloacimonetes bacterium 4572_65]
MFKRFNGTHYSSVSNNRVVIPKPFKSIFNSYQKGLVVITKGHKDCLILFPLEVFDKYCQILDKGNETDIDKLELWEFNAMAEQRPESKIGRIRIAKELADKIGIQDKVKFVGHGDYITIWTPEDSNKYEDNLKNKILNSKERSSVRI